VPLDYDRLLAAPAARKEQDYVNRDTIIYALGVGLGSDPLDERQLAFVWERGLQTLPTWASTLAWTRFADLDLGLTYAKMVHSEQRMVLHRPVPAEGAVYSELRVKDVVDRGAEKGATLYFERTLREQSTGEAISTQILTILARADGGFGGPVRPTLPPHALPERAPDLVTELACSPRSALIYRLTGDVNPLHIDPAAARKSGFQRPILHGLATYGYVGHAILRAVLDYDPSRLLELDGRFSGPVLPGDRLEADIWVDGAIVGSISRRNVYQSVASLPRITTAWLDSVPPLPCARARLTSATWRSPAVPETCVTASTRVNNPYMPG
jgi:acyl dehydratase